MFWTFILILILSIFSCFILVSQTETYVTSSYQIPVIHSSILSQAEFQKYTFRQLPGRYKIRSKLTQLKIPATVCGESEYLCNLVTNPLCKHILKYPLFMQHHHKTGSVLSNHIRKHLAKWCGLMDDNDTINTSLTYRINAESHILHKIFYETNHSSVVLFHFVRDPVDTILSGFYYHLMAKESWLKQHTIGTTKYGFLRVRNLDLYKDIIYDNVDDDNYFEKYWITTKKTKLCFDLPNDINIKFFNQFKNNKYRLDVHMTVQDFYSVFASKWVKEHVWKSRKRKGIKIENDQFGLFWELVRYYNCEWSYQYLMRRIGDKYFDNYLALDLHSFEGDASFDRNMNQIMDAWNIIDNEKNNDILVRAGVVNMNISDETNDLFERLRIERFVRKHHYTKGRFDKKKAIELLLTLNESVCELIKNMTTLLHFEWKHETFC